MKQSEKVNELLIALGKAQSQINPVKKKEYNPFFKSKYADLCQVWECCKKPLHANGLLILNNIDYEDKQLMLETTLFHVSSSQWIRSSLPLPMSNNKNDIHPLGSAITYYKRYNLSALTGLVTQDEDDDGAASVSSVNNKSSEKIAFPINKEKSDELQKILEECEPKYQSNFWSYLKQKVNGLQTLDQLPSEMYEQVKIGLIKKREEYLSNVVNSLIPNDGLAHA